ncbi:hypothetical protein BY458DRAFT_523073 [Sporodiniella umbellata]|nr:hypothetical protein BY458DRAFT_523073 [Sporodiniella umbellata]
MEVLLVLQKERVISVLDRSCFFLIHLLKVFNNLFGIHMYVSFVFCSSRKKHHLDCQKKVEGNFSC